MQRRHFVSRPIAAAALSLLMAASGSTRAQPARPPRRTRWKVRASEGFDALSFLGPLSGGRLYLDFYGADAAAFAPRLPEAARTDAVRLWEEAGTEGVGLLGPNLQVLLSGHDASIDTMLAALRARHTALRPAYAASPYWNEKDWAWFDRHATRIEALLDAMQRAGFAAFRRERVGTGLDRRIDELGRALAEVDVVSWQEKLTGRRFDPEIQIVLLQFSKPHGIKVQGQTFLQAIDYDTATTVRIAAHEMLHPPVPMDGPAAMAARAVLERDALVTRIVRDHDPRWGYTTLKGLLDEDLVQALDQLISEALGVARNPADRWRKADDGIHVIAAGLYGLLRQDRWVETGGSIEDWLARAAKDGRLAPAVLHPVAARVLERPVEALWPVPAAGDGAAGGRPRA